MRAWIVGGVIAAIAAPAAGVCAAPRLEIRGAAAQVVVIPEARGDIQVTVIKASSRLPLKITRFGETTFVDGDVGHRVRGCPLIAGVHGVRIRGQGMIAGQDLPRLAIRTPMDVRISVGDGVSGAIGRSAGLEFENRGCGRWTVGNVRGRLGLSQIGPGEVSLGRADAAELNVAGDGAVSTHAIGGPLTAVSSGKGAIVVDRVDGPVMVRIAGSGSVRIAGGEASQLNVSIAGSGAARFGGQAGSLNASVAGPGYVSVARVTGRISRRVFGAGEIQVGR